MFKSPQVPLRVNHSRDEVVFELNARFNGVPHFQPVDPPRAFHHHWDFWDPNRFGNPCHPVNMKLMGINGIGKKEMVALFCSCNLRVVLPRRSMTESDLRKYFFEQNNPETREGEEKPFDDNGPFGVELDENH